MDDLSLVDWTDGGPAISRTTVDTTIAHLGLTAFVQPNTRLPGGHQEALDWCCCTDSIQQELHFHYD